MGGRRRLPAIRLRAEEMGRKADPKASRPVMPKGYGIRKGNTGLFAWSHVEGRMSAARNYWVCTTTPDGRPHAMPVWGVWIERTLCFGTDR